jgi:hypothetical protein
MFVGEGFRARVTGPCGETSDSAIARTSPLPSLTIPDGEIRVDLKIVSGHDRALPLIYFRAERTACPGGYLVGILTESGAAQLSKHPDCGEGVMLASRGDLRATLARDDWNTLAIRLHGPDLWILINDQVALSARDETFTEGALALGLFRVGGVADTEESAVVFRNLRISALSVQGQREKSGFLWAGN